MEAGEVASAATEVQRTAEQSQALFGEKAAAISQLVELVRDCAETGWDGDDALPLSAGAYRNAADLIRALPPGLPLPEFAPEPDGSISFDWMPARYRLFSISVGASDRLAFAWLDGTNRGYGVERFDGISVPQRIITGVISITDGSAAPQIG